MLMLYTLCDTILLKYKYTLCMKKGPPLKLVNLNGIIVI